MNISITYCTSWGYLNHALSLRNSIINKFGFDVELIKGTGGIFEITLNNSLVFSKKDLGRFPEDGEIEDLIEGYESVT